MSDPPVVPPGALAGALSAAFARHEQDVPVAAALRPAIAAGFRKRRARRRWTVSSAVAFVLALAGSMPLALPDRPTPPVHAETLLEAGSPDVGNFLLLGTDRRPSRRVTPCGPTRSCCCTSTPTPAPSSSCRSPGTLLVEVPNFGTQQVGTAFVFGGYELTSRLVGNLLGVQIDGGAVIDFSAMQRVTEAVGGVDLCVDQQTISIHLGFDASGRVVPLRSGMHPSSTSPAAGTSPAGRPWTTSGSASRSCAASTTATRTCGSSSPRSPGSSATR